MKFWIKSTDGKPSASLTLVMVTFAVVMFWMILGIFQKPFGLDVNPFNAADAMMVLSPLLALYFSRRHTDVKEQEVKLKYSGSPTNTNEQNSGEAG